ncbi:MAG: ATP-binding protein [Bryobacteraceae bacterium]|nr:ATP-binding protein [Bryobacteraceae bacterium]
MPRWPVPQSFRTQLAVVCAASLAVIAVSGILIRDVVAETESRLLDEARRQCEAACRELALQYRERAVWGRDALESLPLGAQDLSLRGLALTVLRSYEGLQGGFYRSNGAGVLGLAASPGSAASLGPRELEMVSSAAKLAGAGPAVVTGWQEGDLLVAVATRLAEGQAAWVLKRVRGAAGPAGLPRRIWYGALVFSALLGIAAVAGIWLSLRAGVSRISAGLRRLEEDFDYRLEAIGAEFGEIARAVNRMAERRRVLEAELRRQDRLAALGKLVAGVAHEIRNPLNSLRLTLELLERRWKKGAATGSEIREALAEIERLDGILARLLAFGRPAPADRRWQDVVALARQAASMVEEQARRKRVTLVLSASGEIMAEVDGPQIVQVLLNLLLNGIHASPEGAPVEVRAEHWGDKICLSVSDRGPGIPEEIRPHIFDAFFTTRPDGSGLGLAVSREIVAAHGGSLELDPAGPGTTFRVVLPAGEARP